MRDRKIAQVATVGLDTRNRSALELMLRGPGRGRYQLGPIQSADIGIIDIDGPGGSSALETFLQESPDMPVIVLSIRNPGMEKVSFVGKPVRVDELLKALRLVLDKGLVYTSRAGNYDGNREGSNAGRAGVAKDSDTKSPPRVSANPDKEPNRTTADPGKSTPPPAPHLHAVKFTAAPQAPASAQQHDIDVFDDRRPSYAASLALDNDHIENVCGNRPDIDLDDESELADRRFFRPNTLLSYVEGAIRQAHGERVPVEIGGLFKSLFVLHNGHVMVGISDRALRSVAIVQLDAKSTLVRPVVVEELRRRLKSESLEYHYERIETFLWKLALWTARGRLPEHMDVDTGFGLKRWPNLTRNELLPHAFPIASSLYAEPQSISGLCSALDIPQRYIFSFFSAADAIRILDQAHPATGVRDHPLPKEKRTVLRRILGRIGY